MRKHCGIMILLLLVFQSGISQVNLVVNPSFEMDTCPSIWEPGDVDLADGWHTFRNGGGGSPDLFNECYDNPPYHQLSVPFNNFVGFQHAKSGVGYVGVAGVLITTGPNQKFREYVQGELINKLTQGNEYCITIHVNLSYSSQYSCVSLGAYLDDGQVQSAPNMIPEPYITPQIVNTVQQLDDTLNWIKIEGSFVANGTEEYISIGNFFPNEVSGVVHSYPLLSGESSFQRTNVAYYYIDDVSVIDISTPAQAGNDTIIHPGESVFIGRQPEIGLNEACIWFVDGVPIDTIAGMWVTPEETTTYVLQQTLCGDIKYDTVTVVVDEFAGVFEYSDISGDLILYPNPSTGEVWFDLKENTDDLRGIAIYSLEGMLLHTELPQGNKINFAFSSGAYIVVLTTKSASYRERVVIIN